MSGRLLVLVSESAVQSGAATLSRAMLQTQHAESSASLMCLRSSLAHTHKRYRWHVMTTSFFPFKTKVTTPQGVALVDVRREATFCRKAKLPIIGIVENMSGFVCPHCAECTNLFSSGGGEKLASGKQIFLSPSPRFWFCSSLCWKEEVKRIAFPPATRTPSEAHTRLLMLRVAPFRAGMRSRLTMLTMLANADNADT